MVNRSNVAPGLKFLNSTTITSLAVPRLTVTVAVGGWYGSLPRHWANLGFANRLKLISSGPSAHSGATDRNILRAAGVARAAICFNIFSSSLSGVVPLTMQE